MIKKLSLFSGFLLSTWAAIYLLTHNQFFFTTRSIPLHDTQVQVFYAGKGKPFILYNSDDHQSVYAFAKALSKHFQVIIVQHKPAETDVLALHQALMDFLHLTRPINIIADPSNYNIIKMLTRFYQAEIDHVFFIDFNVEQSYVIEALNAKQQNSDTPEYILLTGPDSYIWKHAFVAISHKFKQINLFEHCHTYLSAPCLQAVAKSIILSYQNEDKHTVNYRFNDLLKDGSSGPTMVKIPIGGFFMGTKNQATQFANERPRHWVTLGHSIAVAETETTVDQYRKFIEQSDYPSSPGCWYHTHQQEWHFDASADWDRPGFTQTGHHPVTCVTKLDAQAYAEWLSEQTGHHYRLPSEAEFEWFNHSTHTSEYGFSITNLNRLCSLANGADRSTDLQYANTCDDGFAFTAPVAQFPANRFGLFDTTGNVWEFTLDCWNSGFDGNWRTWFFPAPDDGSAWAYGNCIYRVLKGGSWLSSTKNLRATMRVKDSGEKKLNRTGFRLVRELP